MTKRGGSCKHENVTIMKTKATTTIKRGATKVLFNCKVATTNINATTITNKGVGSCKHEKVITTKTNASIVIKSKMMKDNEDESDHCNKMTIIKRLM
jgi:hypothetical protein